MGSLPRDIDIFLSTKFTHLVIGGGTAGLVVATRLAENESLVVGILEAGLSNYEDPHINVPGRFGETLNTEYDWQFTTLPQSGLNGRAIPWARGKVLGGSSALNFMTWNRACKEDYDAWEELGNQGWGWNGLLPFFQKSERLHESTKDHQLKHHSHFDSRFHGTHGPVQISYSHQYGASHQHWHRTLQSLGVDVNRSHFSGSNVGAWTSLTSVEPERRERSYSATAYYRPNAGKSNLVLLTGATVQEILLEFTEGEWMTKGARFSYQGESHSVNVQGEVILCAGSVQSPQLLELSGIGDPNILEAAKINIKVDNPAVGENLQDHLTWIDTNFPVTCMVYEIDPAIPTLESLRSDPVAAKAADHGYETSRTGIRTTIPNSVAYLPFSHYLDLDYLSELGKSLVPPSSPQNSTRESIQARRFTHDQNLGQIEFNFDLSNYSPVFKSEPGKKYATMLQMLQYPFSNGSIHIPPNRGDGLRTTVDDKPVIDPKYYVGKGGKVDLEMMASAQKFAHRIVSTRPLADIIVGRVWPPSPQNGNQEQEDFADWVRDNTITDWHPVGTCAMGPGAGYVVDERLRVHGVKGLRVCDASIMPLQISAHLQATVYAIGEKGASLILEDWEGCRR
ncbi:MAG: hypothetical protein Q9213_002727 [Squamulea squamosa]